MQYIGALIGDYCGSKYEWSNWMEDTMEGMELLVSGKFTDDSVLTVAVMDWINNGHGDSLPAYLRMWANKYPDAGYGGRFRRWVASGVDTPIGSFGNGSAMRVGPVGWAFNTKEEVLAKAKESAECTHNHPEGIKGAQATALCILMARQGAGKEEIRNEIGGTFGYNLRFTCDEIRPSYIWGGTCQDSVPQAIVSFLDGNDFEDCVRNAISIGGDSDTIGCITGSIAEAFYGVPVELRERAMLYLPDGFKTVITEFENKYGYR